MTLSLSFRPKSMGRKGPGTILLNGLPVAEICFLDHYRKWTVLHGHGYQLGQYDSAAEAKRAFYKRLGIEPPIDGGATTGADQAGVV